MHIYLDKAGALRACLVLSHTLPSHNLPSQSVVSHKSVAAIKNVAKKYEAKLWQKLVTTITLRQIGHTENKILLAKVWQKPNIYQLNCG
jgi:hypothetical protein